MTDRTNDLDASIDAILRSRTLTRDEKIAELRRLAYDARETAVATEEGMPVADGDGPDLAAIQAALRRLGATDDPTHPTKH
jgi:hypothetical protein